MTNKDKAMLECKRKLWEKGPFFQSEMAQYTIQMAFEMGVDWKDKQYQELLEKSVQWFNDIAELCSKLTSGNVSHLGATIRGKAIRAAEFIEKHKND